MKYRQRPLYIRLILLMTGLSLFALAVVLTVNASLGLSPWDIFHQGLASKLNITIGQASIGVGLIIILINFIFREKIGIGTVLNTFYIGFLMDRIFQSGVIPVAHDLPTGLLMLFLGLTIVGIASYFYLSAGLGAGPRDGLMVILTKKTGINVAYVRNMIEITATIFGFFLGGTLGIGTVISALTVGFFIRFFFKVFHFDINELEHDYLDAEGIRNILGKNTEVIYEEKEVGE